MTPRACKACGLLEDRRTTANGREETNLDPILQLCVPCLSARAREVASKRTMPAEDRSSLAGDRRDVKQAAAADRE